METTRKHEPTREHIGQFDPIQDGFTCVFCKLKLNGSLGLALYYRNSLTHPIVFDEVCNDQFDQITATQLAIDGDVEQSQIAQIVRKFESRPDCPDLFWQ